MALTYNTLLSEEIKKLIRDTIEENKQNLSMGGGIVDFSDYHRAIGYIRGLRDAIDLCDEAQKKVNER